MTNGLTDTLRAAVAGAARKRVAFDALAQAAYASDSSLLTSTDRRDQLAAALTELAAEGVIRLPVGKNGWDRTALPELPQWVERIQPYRPRPPKPQVRAWISELDQAAAAIRSTSERRLLERINDFLRDGGGGREPVPLRERSYELFGDEKKLDGLPQSRLVTSGALSIEEHLRSFATPPPLYVTYLGAAPWTLVVENAATFASLRHVLREQAQANRRSIGSLAYGAGNLVMRSIASLAERDDPLADLWYFGDLDAKGLEIAHTAASTAANAGLPPLKPAVPLYRALLDRTPRSGVPIERSRACAAAAWLPLSLSAGVVDMLVSGQWLPQEALPLPALRNVLAAGLH